MNKIPKLYEIPKPNKSTLYPNKKYDPIDWNKAFPTSYVLNDKTPIYINGNIGPNILCLHGAGHSGLSFAPLALLNKKFRIISFDFRGHGNNTRSHGEDLSLDTLIDDTVEVLQFINKTYPEDNIIILGHSMGGSVATKTAGFILKQKDKYPELYEKIQGLIIIDIVEGTAMDALPYMENIVNNRPPNFSSVNKAIEYMYKSGTIKNLESARISVPPLIKEIVKNDKKIYEWKTNLLASEKYWTEWFKGLTRCFLNIKIPKILMLAGIERLDKELTIAQMQGKFQLSIVNNVGHVIHEDNPHKVIQVIEEFLHTFRITTKLSEMQPIIGKLGSHRLGNIVKYSE